MTDDHSKTSESLTSGEFARLTGLSRKALRGYEETGLLTPAAADPATGHRRYAPDDVRLGKILQALRDADVPRSALRPVVAAYRAGGQPADTADTIKSYLYREARSFRDHQVDVHRVLGELSEPVGFDGDDVAVRAVPDRLELVGVARGRADAMPGLTATWSKRHAAVAGDAASGPLVLRFVDPVTESLAGRVEFCLPVSRPVVPPPGTALVHRPAGEEATLVLREADDVYPLIASGLETLLDWLIGHGRPFESHAPALTVAPSHGGAPMLHWGFEPARPPPPLRPDVPA